MILEKGCDHVAIVSQHIYRNPHHLLHLEVDWLLKIDWGGGIPAEYVLALVSLEYCMEQ